MEQLPYIDEHAIDVDASRADTWAAITARLGGPPPGFRIGEAREPERFTLAGRHPFAIYEWVFELDRLDAEHTRVRSQTWAAFPGLHGRIYRALVIGTGFHKVAVRRTLRRIAGAVPRTRGADNR